MNPSDLAAVLRSPRSVAGRPTRTLRGIGPSAVDHGVAQLVYRALRDAGTLGCLPDDDAHCLRRAAREAVLIEAFRREDLVRVLAALAARGIRPLLFKGTPLAYTHYEEPWLRPRDDTDLLVVEAQADSVATVLAEGGCARVARPSGAHVTHQFTSVASPGGIAAAYDVHWKIADPQVFAGLFPIEELERAAESVPPLGPHARAVGAPHALLIACAHRVAHHYDAETLVFVCDIDRIARRLTPGEWASVTDLAVRKRLAKVTARGLDLAAAWFETPVPAAVRARLAEPSAEPTAAYLGAGLRRVDILASDMRALGWSDRFELVREHLFPAPRYILDAYGRSSRLLLPILYAHRILNGAAAWFRPLRPPDPSNVPRA